MLIFIIPLIVFSLGLSFSVSAAKPSDFNLKDGDLISAIFSSDPDVYIVNEHGYKRLFLNPEIFKFYGHLGGFASVKLVTPEVRDSFPTTGLFRNCEVNDLKVYGFQADNEDKGKLHWIDTPGDQAVKDDPDFFKKIFCINDREFRWYPRGQELKSVKEVPKYHRINTPAVSAIPAIPASPSHPFSPIASKSTPLTPSLTPKPASGSFSPTPVSTPTPVTQPATPAVPAIPASSTPTPSPTSTPTPTPLSFSVTSLSPTSGPNGTVVTLMGTGFYNAADPFYNDGLCFVIGPGSCINSYTIPTSDTQIQFTVQSSAYLSAKTYNLIFQRSTGSNPLTQTFTVTTSSPTPSVSASPSYSPTPIPTPTPTPESVVFAFSSQNVANITSNSATIAFTTNKAVAAKAALFICTSTGTSTGCQSQNIFWEPPNIGFSPYTYISGAHSIPVSYLKSGTTYTFQVDVFDAAYYTYTYKGEFITPVSMSTFSRDLYLGLSGNDVKQLQALLINEVSYPADLLTGYFGRITSDATKRLQEKYGVRPISGYFGEITRKALSAFMSNQ